MHLDEGEFGRAIDRDQQVKPALFGPDFGNLSKDRLDVHLRPSGEAFCVPREGKALDDRGLCETSVWSESTRMSSTSMPR